MHTTATKYPKYVCPIFAFVFGNQIGLKYMSELSGCTKDFQNHGKGFETSKLMKTPFSGFHFSIGAHYATL